MFSDYVINLLIIVGIIGFIVYYKMMRQPNQSGSDEFRSFYNEVVNSDKYKVKGKYEQ